VTSKTAFFPFGRLADRNPDHDLFRDVAQERHITKQKKKERSTLPQAEPVRSRATA
jgi:hypothetical protein